MSPNAHGDSTASSSTCPFVASKDSTNDRATGGVSASVYTLVHRHLSYTWASSNASLSRVDPLYLVLFSVSATILATQLSSALYSAYQTVHEKGLLPSLQSFAIGAMKKVPWIAKRVQEEQKKLGDRVKSSMLGHRGAWRTELPDEGMELNRLMQALDALKEQDKKWKGRTSGTVYIGGPSYSEHMRLVGEAYMKFAHTNPLHPDVFPSVVQMEAEAVAMTAKILGARGGIMKTENGTAEEEGHDHRLFRHQLPDAVGTEEVCGNITSGGTESILMAVKVARDYMRQHKGITKPELVMAESAHSGYNKACQYFGVVLRVAPVRADFRADVRAIRRLINRSTIMIVGSAPGFPHGVVDPIHDLGALALEFGVCLHVDCCLGGFVLPFAKKLGYPVPPFDFQVPGVTSISVDTHKYGLAPKGTSIVLYRTHNLRRFQYCAVTEWSGGLYVSPTVAGSRSGGLVAAAWAALLSQGLQGYMKTTKQLMEAAKKIHKGIDAIEGLQVLGDPDMTVVAFSCQPNPNDVYRINDAMTARGWTLNALQKPPSVHICITLQHVDMVAKFLEDLKLSTEEVQKNPKAFLQGMAPVYGAAAKIPDRVAVNEFLVDLMESSF